MKRLADRNFAIKISEGVLDSYEVFDEAILFDSSWAIAMDTGCSGFDSYFIALAKIKNAIKVLFYKFIKIIQERL